MSEQSDLILGIRRAMGFDDKPEVQMSREEFDAVIAAKVSELETALAESKAECERLRRVCIDGFDSQRVVEWMRTEPRRRPDAAFTAGGERQAAYLVEMAEDAVRQRNQPNYEAMSETVVDRGRELAALRQQVEGLRKAGRELLDSLHEIINRKDWEAVFTSAAIHGVNYEGPTFGNEAAALEIAVAAALSAQPAAEPNGA